MVEKEAGTGGEQEEEEEKGCPKTVMKRSRHCLIQRQPSSGLEPLGPKGHNLAGTHSGTQVKSQAPWWDFGVGGGVGTRVQHTEGG